MKLLSRLLSLFLLASFFFISACGDDDEDDGPTTDPLVGVYALSSVTLNEDATYYDQEFSAGDDITLIVAAALYDASPCDEGANTVIDLKDDFEILYACKGESTAPERFGVWSLSSDRSTLTLNLSIGGNPFPLVLENLVVTDTGVSGTVSNYPLVEFDMDGNVVLPIQTVSVDIVFVRTTL